MRLHAHISMLVLRACNHFGLPLRSMPPKPLSWLASSYREVFGTAHFQPRKHSSTHTELKQETFVVHTYRERIHTERERERERDRETDRERGRENFHDASLQ